MLAQVSTSLVAQGVPILAPFFQQAFQLSRGEVALLGSALTVGIALSSPLTGWLVDTWGERKTMVTGCLLVGASTALVALSPLFAVAIAWLLVVGVGSSAPTPAGSRAIMGWFPARQRGLAMGIRQTGVPIGSAFAALLLPAIALALDWRWALGIAAVVCGISALVVHLTYQEPHYATTRTGAPGAASPPLRSLFSRNFLFISGYGAMLPIAQFMLVTYLALFLAETQGVPITTSAALLVVAQVVGAAARIALGWSSDRFFGGRRKPPLVICAAVEIGACAALALLPAGAPLALIGLVVAAIGFSAIGWQGNWVALAYETAPPALQGRQQGVAMLVCYGSISLWPPILGALVDATGRWALAWGILALFGALGALSVSLVRERSTA